MLRGLDERAKSEIDELRREGIELSDEDVVRINDACWAFMEPPCQPLAAGVPMKAGCHWLWPLTHQAAHWLDATIDWFGSEHDTNMALCYALAYGRTRNAFSLMYSEDYARDELRKLDASLTCTPDELVLAMNAVIQTGEPPPMPSDPNGRDPGPTEMIAGLVAAVGGTPDMWERLVSLNFITQQFEAANKQAEAGERNTVDRNSLMARATYQLGTLIDSIRKRGHDDAQ